MNVFTEISIIIFIAMTMAGIMQLLKQPLIMGHILTGLVAGPYFLNLTHSSETIETFSQIGIAVLLFIVGLGLSPKIVREVGKIAVITGVGQVLFTTFFGSLIALAFGYSLVETLFIAVALTFSSTIIILKLLTDKKDVEKLYGRISIGFLLVQDIIATIILVVVSTASKGDMNAYTLILFTILKGAVLTAILSFISIKILPTLSGFFAKSQEFLFLFAIGWGLGLANIFAYMGFSIEIGALIAGVTLSMSPYNHEIGSKLKPLRDFFIIMFFVLLGMKMSLDSIATILPQALVFSAFVLIGNPVIVMVLMGLLRYNKKTGFMAGLTVAQISEFSLILILLGVQAGHLSQKILSLVTVVGLITIAGSTYLIIYSETIYAKLAKYLVIFERKSSKSEHYKISSPEVVLFGCNRVGYDFLKLFKELGNGFLAVDFDPLIIKQLNAQGFNCIYGDAEDAELIEALNLQNVKMIISTIPDYETNTFLISKAISINPSIAAIVMSHNLAEALQLYDKGAAYVILPHFIGGHFSSMLAGKHWAGVDDLLKQREKNIEYLKNRVELGHTHPTKDHS
ncbi:cation:proton antiporter [Candidatus Nomurabacteria bacterium]|mgnify:CR=1 FL=1|uniref:Cation:proton antiporter n=1 Tax=candidate division WWE3 bacterium TaxID=2053526 RepID=A0A955E0M2_UNCKA|nr:cation:proton antiporter [candidate division WWE3 bacterium]MCB9823475.1 cation:proton antiporter [Candidatus Nomurabacteria bacterium]MCB9827757.1 cation:proton antiporter [Candidatus Nomurabacteria bacterium]HXK52362.1 cation:proton antiporter [bacterium]